MIMYLDDDITFDYPVRSLHPDLLGLLCLIIFYPFIGRRVVFPMPVSPRLERTFRKPRFERQFHFDNVDPGLEVYAGSKLAISGGGGGGQTRPPCASCSRRPSSFTRRTCGEMGRWFRLAHTRSCRAMAPSTGAW